MKAPNECMSLDDIPEFLRVQYEAGEQPCNSPPGFTELYYQRWLKLGGKPTPPKPVYAEDTM